MQSPSSEDEGALLPWRCIEDEGVAHGAATKRRGGRRPDIEYYIIPCIKAGGKRALSSTTRRNLAKQSIPNIS